MYHFYTPLFAFLFLLPYLIRKYDKAKIEGKNDCAVPEIHFPALHRLKAAFQTHHALKPSSDRLFIYLFSLAWFFLVLALMQPEKVDQINQTKNKGYDLMLAVDTSLSMQAVDFSTSTKVISRLDATKNVVSKFVQGRQGDRVGLVTFGQHAYLHVPLTLDTVSVSRMLNDTVSGMAGNATAIGDAIGLSVRTLRERPEGSRVLILLTDGDDNSSSIPPMEAAKLAKQYGIRIYTIGVGKNGLVPVPTPHGGYAMAQVSLDEDLLKEMASLTGGQYFLATDQRALESIYGRINELEKTESNETVYLIREPLYYYPLACAMVILLILSIYQLTRIGRIHVES